MIVAYLLCRHLKSGVNTSRFILGSLLQSTNTFDCCNTLLGIDGMSSALSQIILANVTFLISCSWHRVKAVLSVFFLRFGAFSCQKRSPSRRRLNWSANRHWKVFPSAPPSESAGSSIPVKNHNKGTITTNAVLNLPPPALNYFTCVSLTKVKYRYAPVPGVFFLFGFWSTHN